MSDGSVPHGSADDTLRSIFSERRTLLNLAYRMLGSSHDAEDVVQETYIRWYVLSEEERQEIRAPMAWLVRVAGRICLDQLASARARREQYIGDWLPEPLPDASWNSAKPPEQGMDPADHVTLDESVTMGMLVVLDSVTPAERVSFVLHDIFGIPFSEIAETVGRSPVACRQLATSARRRIRSARPRAGSRSRHAAVIAAFKKACGTGNFDALVRLLDPAAVVNADGGGKARTALRPVIGADKVARLFLGKMKKEPAVELTVENVNGEPGLVARLEGRTIAVIAMEINEADVIDRIWLVMNPDKLHAWQK